MKKVLILAYDFPPYVSVGGLRPYSWSKYLNEFGIHPIIVTRQWSNRYKNQLDYIAPSESMDTVVESTDNCTIIRTPYKPNFANRLMLKYGESKYRFFRKSLSAYYELMQWMFNVGPKVNLYTEARNYLKNNKVDAIIATGDPYILFKYASKLSEEFNLSWIADYRDPWSQDKCLNKNLLFKKWNNYFESKYTKNVSVITTVSDFFKYQISLLVKNKPIKVLTNGYDPETIKGIENINQKSDVMRIGMMGTINKWHPLESFIEDFSKFIIENPNVKIELNFYGINVENELTQLIDTKYLFIKKHINIFSKMPNEKLLTELAQNNIMLLFNSYSIIGTKIYDYLAVKRSIMLCYSADNDALELKDKFYLINDYEGFSSNAQVDLINKTNAGNVVVDRYHLKTLLLKLYTEFESTGMIKCNSHNIEFYSRRSQAEELAKIIDNL